MQKKKRETEKKFEFLTIINRLFLSFFFPLPTTHEMARLSDAEKRKARKKQAKEHKK